MALSSAQTTDFGWQKGRLLERPFCFRRTLFGVGLLTAAQLWQSSLVFLLLLVLLVLLVLLMAIVALALVVVGAVLAAVLVPGDNW